MKQKITLVLLLFFLNTFAQQARVVYSVSRGNISFNSAARLELIKANSQSLRGFIDASNGTFAFAINMNTFEGFNVALQREHFNEKYMESTLYPSASFKGKIIEDVDLSKDGTYHVRVKGIMNIHGVEQERIIPATVVVSNGMLNITSKFSVLLKDHNIKVPKVVNEKIATEVFVEVTADMIRK